MDNLFDTVSSLLLCGIIAVMMEHYEEAEIFFEDATCLEPSSIVSWTLLGMRSTEYVLLINSVDLLFCSLFWS